MRNSRLSMSAHTALFSPLCLIIGCFSLMLASMPVAGAIITLIDFETGTVAEGGIVEVWPTSYNSVTIAGGTANMRIAEVGDPVIAFNPFDTPVSGNPGSFFLTNGTSSIHDAYFFTFSNPISSFGLDLYDYRAEGGGAFNVEAGDTATLTLYSDTDMTIPVGEYIYTVPLENPPDGNVIPLSVLNPTSNAFAASVLLSGNDIGTGVDNILFTTVIPVPSAVWLFGSGLLGLIGMARRRKA